MRKFAALFLLATMILAPAAAKAAPAPESFADLAEKLTPAVVNISTTMTLESNMPQMQQIPEFPPGSPFEDFFRDFFEQYNNGVPMPHQRKTSSLGSGFVVDAENGYIVTNNHVIKDADEIKVTLQDDSTHDAEIVGIDEKTDIAVLKIKTDRKLAAISWGNSGVMRVGDWVLAVGNPFGLGGTVTAGIISARQRNINAGPYDDFIQTDASINRGNSGGPMFNIKGEVIGVNTAIFSPSGGSVGIGFAVPSDLARPVVDQLIKYGQTKRGWIGVRIQHVTDEIAESLGLDKAKGALVASLTPDGPADKAGLEAGDVIVEFNVRPIGEMRELPRIVAETEVGSKVPLKVWRKGKVLDKTITLGQLEKAEENGLLAKNMTGDEKSEGEKISDLGIYLADLTPDLQKLYNLGADVKGVVITRVEPDSPAAEKGLGTGDVIVEVDQEVVSSPADVEDRVKKAKKVDRGSVLFLVNHNGDLRFVAVKLKDKSDG